MLPTRPRPAAALALALAASVLAGAARAAETVALAWRIDKGAALRYRYTSEQESVHALAEGQAGGPLRTKQREEVEYRLSALEGDAAGAGARVLCRYEQIAVDLEQMVLGRVQFDSRKREDLARAAEPVVRPYAQLVGQEFSFVLSPRGEVSDIRGHDKVREAVLRGLEDSAYARLALGGAFSDAAVRGALERTFAVLPPEPSLPGARWKRTFEQPVAVLGALTYDVAFTLESVEAGEATIRFEARLGRAPSPTPEVDPVAARAAAELTSGTGTGKAVFDAAAGRLERSEADFTLEIRSHLLPPVAPASGPGAATAASTIRQKIRVDRIAD